MQQQADGGPGQAPEEDELALAAAMAAARATAPEQTAPERAGAATDAAAAAAAELAATVTASAARVEQILAESAIRIVFQPIVELSSEKIIGYEALSRFADHPELSPQAWFEEAAAAGLQVRAEVAAARAALQVFDRLPSDAFVALNVSARTAASGELLNALSVIPAARVVLEITESEAVEGYGAMAAAIDELRALGVRIALDDTGAGHVSLRHLLGVHADIIKIDTAVTRGIESDPVNQALAYSLKSLAERAGALSLAEGIETHAELEMLRSLAIEAGQGYLFGRPKAIDTEP